MRITGGKIQQNIMCTENITNLFLRRLEYQFKAILGWAAAFRAEKIILHLNTGASLRACFKNRPVRVTGLFKFTTEQGGRWKSSSNEIAELRPDGTKLVRFAPVAPAFNGRRDALLARPGFGNFGKETRSSR